MRFEAECSVAFDDIVTRLINEADKFYSRLMTEPIQSQLTGLYEHPGGCSIGAGCYQWVRSSGTHFMFFKVGEKTRIIGAGRRHSVDEFLFSEDFLGLRKEEVRVISMVTRTPNRPLGDTIA